MKFIKTLTLTAAMFLSANSYALDIEVFTASPAGFHVTSTLIKGKTDAILIDAQFTLSDAHRLVAQILDSGKSLKQIFITHAHPDHYFGLEVVLSAFPKAEVLAAPEVSKQMKTLGPKKLAQWKPLYGHNLTSKPLVAKPFKGSHLVLDGERIALLNLLPSEIEHTTALYIPSLKTLIGGDQIYNGVHVWLAETDASRRQNWLRNIDRMIALNPVVVVAGHKLPGLADNAASLSETRDYIIAFSEALAGNKNPNAVIATMNKRHGDRALPIILDIAAKAMFADSQEHQH